MKALRGSTIIAMIALMLVIAPVMASDESGNFTIDDASSFFSAMQKTDFGDIEISGNNIIFYSPDGSVKCKGQYDYVGSKTVDFQGHQLEWHMFNLRSDKDGCSEYKHVIMTAVHDEAGLTHWHMRYGKLCFDILMDNPAYEMWYPTMAVEGTTVETIANAYGDQVEMIGAFVVASREAANKSITLADWNGRWVNTEGLLDDPLMNPIYEAASSAANALNAKSEGTNGAGNDTSPSFEKAGKELGVLVIAHGSDDDLWCRPVRETVANISLPFPVELGFLEFVPNESINNAIDRLDSQGVTKIIAVPLFISSYSSHIQEIEYVLRLRDTLASYEDLARVNTTANITMTRALDDHPLLAYILADQIAEISRDPSNETVVILSHGTGDEDDISSQVCCQSWLAEEVKTYLRYRASPSIRLRDVKYAFIHGNRTLYPDLTVESVMQNASETIDASEDGNGSLIVLPLMVSGGSITNDQIPKILEDYDCLYERKTLASHPNLARWIEQKVAEEVRA